jgi:hypothetical protein
MREFIFGILVGPYVRCIFSCTSASVNAFRVYRTHCRRLDAIWCTHYRRVICFVGPSVVNPLYKCDPYWQTVLLLLRKKESFSSHTRKVKRVGLGAVRDTVCWYIKNTRRHVIKSVLCERYREFAGKERRSVFLCASGNSICNFASLVFIVINKLIKRNFNVALKSAPE